MLRLNHVALTVSNREKSAGFYASFFEMTDRVHDDDHLLILASASGSLLALSEGPVPAPPPRTSHFGFEAKSAAAVLRLREAFRKAGVREAEWQESGPMRVQVFDPDGYRVEVFTWD